MVQDSAWKFPVSLCILSLVSFSAADNGAPTFDQGWRKLHSFEGREEMKNKMALAEAARAAAPARAASWGHRDKNLSPARRAELNALKEGEFESPSFSLVAMLFGIVMCIVIYLARKHARSEQKVFQKMSNSSFGGFFGSGLVHQASVVIRHSTTRKVDSMFDAVETGAEALSSTISRLTTKVQEPRWMKKEDPDFDDLVQLQSQCKIMTDDFMSTSLLDLDDKVDSIVKPAENLKVGMQWAMDELLLSVDGDLDEELTLGIEPNLEPIDQL